MMVKHGQHIFYRPHRWGNGEDEAGWGVASLTHSTPQDKTKTVEELAISPAGCDTAPQSAGSIGRK